MSELKATTATWHFEAPKPAPAPSGREADMQLRRHLIGAIRAIESKWGMEQSIPERVR